MKFVSSSVAALAAGLVMSAMSLTCAVAAQDPGQQPASEAADTSAQNNTASPAAPASTGEAKAAAADKTEDKHVAPRPKPKPSLVINVDLTRQNLTVSEGGSVVGSWAISSGRSGYRTPTGSFRPQWMAKTWYSRKYDDAPMPNSIFFTGGFALHATYSTGMLGRPASHGCVRQSPANAARLFGLVKKHGMDRTKIVVHGAPRDRGPAVAGRERSRRYASNGGEMQYSSYARPSKPSTFSSLFGDDEPRVRYVPPRRVQYGRQGVRGGRPLYVYDRAGNLIRVR
jgi:lipoprotein-anchoring transpeptidase ErfK/SrfK